MVWVVCQQVCKGPVFTLREAQTRGHPMSRFQPFFKASVLCILLAGTLASVVPRDAASAEWREPGAVKRVEIYDCRGGPEQLTGKVNDREKIARNCGAQSVPAGLEAGTLDGGRGKTAARFPESAGGGASPTAAISGSSDLSRGDWNVHRRQAVLPPNLNIRSAGDLRHSGPRKGVFFRHGQGSCPRGQIGGRPTLVVRHEKA